jgi:hypothetical protein
MPYEPHELFVLRDDQITIWRYQRLERTLEILRTGELYLARADTLGDPFEGSFSNASLEHLRGFHPSHIAVTLAASLSSRMQCMVCCWHANEDESEAMWSTYGQKSPAVAICSTPARLKRALEATDVPIYIGEVTYVDYDTVSISDQNMFYPLLHKRRIFDYEKEIRAVRLVPRRLLPEDTAAYPRGIHAKIDLGALVEAIVIAPNAPEGCTETLISALRNAGFPGIPVRKSRLNDSPRF